LLIGALVTVAAGVALGAITTESKSFDVAAGETRERTATCERGRAVSGGFRAPIPGGNAPFMLPLDSTRQGGRGWRLRTQNSGQAGKATAYVYCRKGMPALTTASSAPTSIAKDDDESITAQCEPGAEAVAGGFESPDARTHLLASKRTTPGSWRVRLLNDSNGAQQYTAFAYCDSSEPGLKARSKTITADGFEQSATASCRRSQGLRSGGFEIERDLTGPAEQHDLGLVHASRRRGERGWRATAFAFLGSPEMTAYAYCK
jgi:hypothetical protein